MLKKGAGARYIRQFLFKGKKGRAHDTFDNFCLHNFWARKKGRAHDTFDKLSLQVPQGGPSMGGTPRRAPKRSISRLKRAILSTLWLGGQNPSLDCSSPAPGCFRGRIVREWAQVAEKSARVSTLRRKKCETFLPSTNKQGGARYIRQIVPPSVEKRGGRTIHSSISSIQGGKKGRAHDTFDNFCSSRWKKGAGARYIRRLCFFNGKKKRGGRTIHSTNCPFRSLKGVPQWGGPHGEPRRGRVSYDSNGPF